MLAAPSVAIDLPLKILIWEDAQGGLDKLQQPGLFAGAARLAEGVAAKYSCGRNLSSHRRGVIPPIFPCVLRERAGVWDMIFQAEVFSTGPRQPPKGFNRCRFGRILIDKISLGGVMTTPESHHETESML
jgi:hypothetical protein